MSFQHRLESLTPSIVRSIAKKPFLPLPGSLNYDRRPQRVALWDLACGCVLLRRHLLLTVQLITVCRETGEVLTLRTPDYGDRHTPIQGLLTWRRLGLAQPEYEGDPIADVCREAAEECLVEPPPAQLLEYRGCWRDGAFGQFLALVYVWDIARAADKPALHDPTSEGTPMWLPREQIDAAFHNQHVANLAHAVFDRAPLPQRPRAITEVAH